MMTIGLIEVGGQRLDYVPVTADGWRLVQLASKNRRQLERALSSPKLNAVAILGSSPEKTRLAEQALVNKKHVLVDFPVAEAFQKAAKLNKIATRVERCIYSPNLLRTEPGLQELKRIITHSASKLLSLTVTCGVKARPGGPEFSMRTAQILDAIEWLGDSALREVSNERSAVSSSAAALVALVSFDNELKAMLNMYSAPARGNHHRLWIDAVFADSVVHLDPRAQSIKIASFRNESVNNVNWATQPLLTTIEDFISCMKAENLQLDSENLQRMLKLTGMVVIGD
jgi:predicted dehydrogenase